ncbi:MAG: hypothetical protein IJK25_07785, partial [Firmicutes bacterium]|nr:hypothetical protein [Bacillota bacterium]
MESLFFKVLAMSAAGGIAAAAALVLRPVLKKCPARARCILWALVALRLVLPFAPQSGISLIPERVADGTAVREAVGAIGSAGSSGRV